MENSTFVYVVYIRTTQEKLWDALRKKEFTQQYWCETWQDTDWQKGSAWKLMTPDGRVGDEGEVLEIDPPKKFAVSWRHALNAEMQAEGHSRATFELETVGDTVKLTVSHEMDKPRSKLIGAISNGWPPILSSLKSLLETGSSLALTREWPKGV
jgi:uncharacterized protein YndB with AHSA1/START domain